jgi:hypothetical protein
MPLDDKTQSQHVDAIGTTRSASPSVQNEYVDTKGSAGDGDEIVQNLAQAGEEVGMTWRSILAAAVSPDLLFT